MKKKNKMYEWRVSEKLIVFDTTDFCTVPEWLDDFRVGPWVGKCVIKVGKYVMMHGRNCIA